MAEITHRVTIRYLRTDPPGVMVFELKDVKTLPEILRELADKVEKDEHARSDH